MSPKTEASKKILSRLTPYAVTSRYNLERDELLDESQASELVVQVQAWATSKVIPK